MFKQYKLKNYKFILIALVVILNTIGVALVGSASPGDQKKADHRYGIRDHHYASGILY